MQTDSKHLNIINMMIKIQEEKSEYLDDLNMWGKAFQVRQQREKTTENN